MIHPCAGNRFLTKPLFTSVDKVTVYVDSLDFPSIEMVFIFEPSAHDNLLINIHRPILAFSHKQK